MTGRAYATRTRPKGNLREGREGSQGRPWGRHTSDWLRGKTATRASGTPPRRHPTDKSPRASGSGRRGDDPGKSGKPLRQWPIDTARKLEDPQQGFKAVAQSTIGIGPPTFINYYFCRPDHLLKNSARARYRPRRNYGNPRDSLWIFPRNSGD